ncbi:MAG: energy transducer TonB [Vulcanimicrobiaceae bacterium]
MSRAFDVAGLSDMERASNLRVLRIAIAASLALHLLVAPFVRMKSVDAAPEQPAMRTDIVHLARPKPTPRPTPTPSPKRIKPTKPAAHTVAIHPVVLHQHPSQPGTVSQDRQMPPIGPVTTAGDAPASNADVPGTATSPSPSVPTPTPKPACTAPDVPAKTIAPVIPEIPESARDQGLTGTAEIEVRLSAAGAVLGASIYRSSGSMLLDQEALRAARASTYAPEQRECQNISGSYLFTAQFDQ